MTLFEFSRKWHRRSALNGSPYFYPNQLFKYMDQKYIDLFFETGSLKLSTFQYFEQIEDKTRIDDQEGTHDYLIWNKDRSHHVTLRRSPGTFNLLFCTSSSDDFDFLSKKFNVNGYFRINNPYLFAYECTKVITEFLEGMDGPAIYTPSGNTNIFAEKMEFPDFNKTTPMSNLFESFHKISISDFDLYYSKRLMPYAMEREHRFVWRLKSAPKKESIIIKCPEAIKYCEKLK